MKGLRGTRAELNEENLKAILTDMGVGPGWHTAHDLYQWYFGMAIEQGLEQLSKKAFGLRLKAMGYVSSTQRKDGRQARCWYITRRAFRG